MKKQRYQILLETKLIKTLDEEAKKKEVTRVEHINDLLKASLEKEITLEKSEPITRYLLTMPRWLKKELSKRADDKGVPLAKYIRAVCWQLSGKKK